MSPAAPVTATPPWGLARAAGAVIIATAIVGITDTVAAPLHFAASLEADAIAALTILAVAWLSLGDAAKAPTRAAAVGCVSSLLVLGFFGIAVATVMEGGGDVVAAAVFALSLALTAACAAFVRWLRGVCAAAAEDAADRILRALAAALCALGVPWLLARSTSEDLGAAAPALVVAGGMSTALVALARSRGRAVRRPLVGARVVIALCLAAGVGGLAVSSPRWRQAYANRFRGFQARPTPVAGIEGAPRALVAANSGACAVLEDDRVACWGENLGRFLGKADRPHDARALEGLHDVEQFALGPTSACAALRSRPETWCWKADDPERHKPGAVMTVAGLPKVARLSIAGAVGYAAAADGSLYRFRLDAGAPVAERLPLAGIQDMAASQHICAVDRAGAVWCWGESAEGQCGMIDKEVDEPRRIDLPKPAARIAAGGPSTWAVLEDGSVFWWGSARTATGDWVPQLTPRAFPLPESARQIATGRQSTCALTEAKRVLCWSQADAGVLSSGDGGATGRGPSLVPGAEGIEEIVADDNGVCARATGGQVSCWGRL